MKISWLIEQLQEHLNDGGNDHLEIGVEGKIGSPFGIVYNINRDGLLTICDVETFETTPSFLEDKNGRGD